MALKDDIAAINADTDIAAKILYMNSLPSFRVDGLDLVILRSQIPQVLADQLRNDLNGALARIKAKAAGLPNSV